MHLLKRYKILISRGIGALSIVIALGILFWDYANTPISRSEVLAQKRVAMMEARSSGKSTSNISEPSMSAVYLEKQSKDVKIILITMILLGLGSFIYSFLQKPLDAEN